EMIKKIIGALRKRRCVLYPLDSSDAGKAQEWIFEGMEKLENYPVCEEGIPVRSAAPENGCIVFRWQLKELAGVSRLGSGIIEQIVDSVRKRGFVLYPLDASDTAKAQEWIFERVGKLKKYQAVNHYAFQRAEGVVEKGEDQ